MIITYLKLFCTFAKIGMFTIGGGYAMIPLIEREIVKRKWMSKEEFMEMFALTQSLPGVFAVNISIFVGYKLHKVCGHRDCALETTLSLLVIMIVDVMFLLRLWYHDDIIIIFNAVLLHVAESMLFPCISAVRALHLKYVQLIAPVIATVLIWQFGLSPIYVVLAGISGGLVYTLWLKNKIKYIKACDIYSYFGFI